MKVSVTKRKKKKRYFLKHYPANRTSWKWGIKREETDTSDALLNQHRSNGSGRNKQKTERERDTSKILTHTGAWE